MTSIIKGYFKNSRYLLPCPGHRFVLQLNFCSSKCRLFLGHHLLRTLNPDAQVLLQVPQGPQAPQDPNRKKNGSPKRSKRNGQVIFKLTKMIYLIPDSDL